MIAPLDLSTEEREIYWLLYRRMDFDTFKVKYTLEQLAYDSSQKLELTKKKVSTIIKKFIAEDFLTVTSKGTKGNPTIYLITKMADIKEHKGNLTDTQKKLKGNLKGTNEISDTNVLDDVEEHKGNLKETQRELKGNTKVTPINDIDKENDIYSSISEIRSLYLGTKSKAVADKKIPVLIKKYSKGELIRGIERYNKYVKEERKKGFKDLKYKNESTYWNGGYMDYLDENFTTDINKVIKPKMEIEVKNYG